MADVRVDRLRLRLPWQPGRDGQRLAEEVAAALAALAGWPGPPPPAALRLRLPDDPLAGEQELAGRIAGEVMRSLGTRR